jgi:predicted O-methyltransferase YrrM
MAYHGYIPLIHQYSHVFESPRVLEIGVDVGITTISIIQRLIHTHKSFNYVGVDIKIQDNVRSTLSYIYKLDGQDFNLVEENSLKYLEDLQEKFDIILIDGDHNYFTVAKELSYLDKISHKETLVICDDYNGRWSNRDLYYSERPGYENSLIATKRYETQKTGVKPAIDEFLDQNTGWVSHMFMPGEPIALFQKENKNIKIS